MERQIISSRQNALVKQVCALCDKKGREKQGLFRFDGSKLLEEALSSDAKIEYVFCSQNISERAKSAVERALCAGRVAEDRVISVTESVFEKMSEESAPEGVITVACFMDSLHSRVGEDIPKRILIAESLRDPGNLGTVMRSAYALGMDALILTDDCANVYNPKTLRAAMGAAFKLPTRTVPFGELEHLIAELRAQGRAVYATALREDSRDLRDIELREGDCFVIGNEGHGLTESAVAACTAPVIIPMREGAESLNAAAAAAICIWETVRV